MGLTAVVSVKVPENRDSQSQTKTKLSNGEVDGIVQKDYRGESQDGI